MRKSIISAVFALCFCGVLPAQHFTITSPAGGEVWYLGSTQTISFTLTVQDMGPMDLSLYKGTTYIGTITSWINPQGYQPGNFTYPWMVGTLYPNQTNSDLIVAGSDYSVKLFTMAGCYSAQSNTFSIIHDPRQLIERIRHIKALGCKFPPHCPLCGVLDLAELRGILAGNPEPMKIFLFFHGQQVTLLGQSGRNGTLADSLQVRFAADPFAAIQKGGAQFELRLINLKGILVHSQTIQIQQSR